LLFREEEYQELLSSVSNRVGVLLIGPVGSGKTSLVKLLQRELGADRLAYVDCLVHDTEYSVLREIVPSVRAPFLRSTFQLVEELRRISRDKEMTVCFDNFVRLKELEAIDKVSAIGITVILVSSVERDLALLTSNATPKLARTIRLKNYDSDEALRILKARSEQGLARGSCGNDLLKSIVNSTNGNITLGISVLRAAALRAEAHGRGIVELEDLRTLLPEYPDDLELTEDERIIMQILREKRAVEHRQLYTLYCQSTASPKQERTFRNYMQRLVAKSFITVNLSNGSRIYGIVEQE
jgi:Cdc6-like AAA superfamily ATPase